MAISYYLHNKLIVAYEIGKTAVVCVIPDTSFSELRNSHYRSASAQLSSEQIDV
jgi:hypothetical protein